MAYNIEKNYICTTRKQFLQKVYDFLAAGDSNWSIIHEEGGYDSGAPADGDYFVIECDTPWADAAVNQQLLFCARDAATGTSTFGGVGGADWTILDDSISFIYSPDGGWNVGTKNFSSRVGSLAEKQIDWDASTIATPGITGSFISAPDAFIIQMTSQGNKLAMYAGAITSLDTAVDDPRPCHFFWGRNDLNRTQTQGWGYYLTGVNAQGFVPNAARNAWEYSYVSYEYNTDIDLNPMTKNGNKWVELPMLVYDADAGRVAGVMEHTRRVAVSLTYCMESNDGTRISYDGISFPWG